MIMSSRLLRYSIVLVIGVLLVQPAVAASAYRAHPAPAQNDMADWTVMIYMAGDNDLEGFALGDLNEMEFSGSTPQVNIVAQLDRSELYDSSQGNWTDTRRYYITPDASIARLNSTEVGSVDEGVALSNGDYAVIHLVGVSDGDPAAMTEQERAQIRQGYQNLRRSLTLSALVDDLRARADVELPEEQE